MPYPHPPHTNCKYCDKMISQDKEICDGCEDKKATIKVVETEAPVADSTFMATFGDYDLDCKTGLGDSEESAIDDLMWKAV